MEAGLHLNLLKSLEEVVEEDFLELEHREAVYLELLLILLAPFQLGDPAYLEVPQI